MEKVSFSLEWKRDRAMESESGGDACCVRTESELLRHVDLARGLKAKRFVHLYYASGNVTSDGS